MSWDVHFPTSMPGSLLHQHPRARATQSSRPGRPGGFLYRRKRAGVMLSGRGSAGTHEKGPRLGPQHHKKRKRKRSWQCLDRQWEAGHPPSPDPQPRARAAGAPHPRRFPDLCANSTKPRASPSCRVGREGRGGGLRTRRPPHPPRTLPTPDHPAWHCSPVGTGHTNAFPLDTKMHLGLRPRNKIQIRVKVLLPSRLHVFPGPGQVAAVLPA